MAAPIIEFAALGEGVRHRPEIGQTPPVPEQSDPQPPPVSKPNEGGFQVRGKWLQFDCPHCVRPMRLIVEDAGGLVDCAHCGLELIAPDPAIGRGAQLSRASEGRVGSIASYNLRGLRGDQLKHSKSQDAADDEGDDDEYEYDVGDVGDEEDGDVAGEAELDPNHALARSEPAVPAERKRAIKALDVGKLGRSFRRQEVVAEQALAASDVDWEPRAADRPNFGESRQDKYGFWIAAGVAGAVMIGVAAMVVREASSSGKVFDDTELSEIRSAQRTQTARFQSSFDAAKRALASPSWAQLVAHVRNPQLVAPLMRNYYATNPYEPLDLTGFHAPVEVEVGGLSMNELRATDASGEVRTLVIDTAGEVPKLDWELFVNYAQYGWEQFLEARPATPQRVSVVAGRSSVLDRYFEDAGLTRKQATGIRLWQGEEDSYYAILPKGSEMEKKMTELLEWTVGRKLIIRASFPPESKLNDRIRIDGFDQTGWVK